MNEEMNLNPQVPKTPDCSQIFALRQCDNFGICPSSGEGGGDNSGPGVGLVAGHANVISDAPPSPCCSLAWETGSSGRAQDRAGGGSARKQVGLGLAAEVLC